MKKDENRDAETDWLIHKLTGELERMDAQYENMEPPALQVLEQKLVGASLQRRRKERKELLLFWIVSLFLISSTLAVLTSAPAVYMVIQAAFPVAALAGFAITRSRRKREGTEE